MTAESSGCRKPILASAKIRDVAKREELPDLVEKDRCVPSKGQVANTEGASAGIVSKEHIRRRVDDMEHRQCDVGIG